MEEQSLALVLVVLVYQLCIQGCQGDTTQNVTIAEDSPANFLCNVDNVATTIWLFTRRDGGTDHETLSQGATVYARFENKFTLDGSSDNTTSHSLTLKFNGTEEDEGLYLCQEGGITMAQFNLTVESPPVLHLEMENTVVNPDSKIDVVSNQEYAITCVAEGGKPQVKLSWMINGKERTGPFINNPPPSSERSVTSIIHYVPVTEDKTLTCVSSGQQVIPEKEVSIGVDVQYLPNCVMGVSNTTNAFVITCSCKANPEVKGYEIYVNNSLFSDEMRTTLPSEKPATVYCNATNDVGSFATKQENLKAFHEVVPIQLTGSSLVIGLILAGVTLVVLISAVVVAVCMYRKKRKDAEDAEANVEEAEQWAGMNKESADMSLKPLPAEEDFPEEGNTQEEELLKKDSDKATQENTHKEDEDSKKDQNQVDGSPASSSPKEQPKEEKKNLLEDNDDKEAVSTGNEI